MSKQREEYETFLGSKAESATETGVEVEDAAINQALFPFQRTIVRWTLRRGRAAVFAATGMGKTAMQLAWADHVRQHTGGAVLILAPLAVSAQTVREGEKFGIRVVRADDQSGADPTGIAVTNYQRLSKFDPRSFAGVVLDESSILKSYMGAVKREILSAFVGTPWKLSCTATPAPNDHLELGNQAQFLEVMDSNEMISRWFVNNPMEAGDYRLKRHAEADFWRWLATWAVAIERPSDLGEYDDSAYALPTLDVAEVVVPVDHSKGRVEGELFRSGALSASNMHREMRLTAAARAAAVARLVAAEPDERWLIWCNADYEADALAAAIPGAVEVRGSDSAAVKEDRLLGFADGRVPVLVTKPTVAGFGMNFQICARVAFVGLSYSFEQQFQAVRRVWRFGQTRPVRVWMVRAETEGAVLAAVREKEAQHGKMLRAMVDAVKAARLEADGRRRLSSSAPYTAERGEGWELRLGDCVGALADVADQSVGHCVFSPPFSNLYIYSDKIEDMGNSADHEEFFRHYGFLARELLRVTKAGRICAVHCKDLPLYMGRDGAAGLYDFPGRLVRAMEDAGWTFHSRVTIWKCPVTEMQRTKNHGLLYKNLRADSCGSRMGMADFVLAFRRWNAECRFEDPVSHTEESFPLDRWQKWASPVWDDINQMDVLDYKRARDEQDERHICPLQLGVIRRCVTLWSNPGDVVLSPFAGIGSEGYVTVGMGRRFLGVEIKDSYFRIATSSLKRAELERKQSDLFDVSAASTTTSTKRRK